MYDEDDYLMLSGLQHFAYCRRQWALIHIEQQWSENELTIDGQLMHKTAHNAGFTEKRGDVISVRGLSVKSAVLGITGVCDVVEFHKSNEGISLSGYEGLWRPFPIEYKRGKEKFDNIDEIQLCAQAICLEEMLQCSIPCGSLFYGQSRRRTEVDFTNDLRSDVRKMAEEMHMLWDKGYTPKVKPHKGCNACSLKESCLPRLSKTESVSDYISHAIKDLT